MRFIIFILGLLFSAIGLYLGYTSIMGIGEGFCVLIGIIFILWSVFYDSFKTNKFLRFVKGMFVAGISIIVIYSCIICVLGSTDTATYNEDYVIVLGAGLNGSEPSPALERRLDKTVEYMNRNQNATVIVSGGQGPNESISEAQAMQLYLMDKGIDDDKILLETESTSTYENFSYTKDAVSDGSVVFITNNFHVLRSSLMAQLNGIDAAHIGASTPLTSLPASCIREFFAQIASIRYYI